MNDQLYCAGATSDCLFQGGLKVEYRPSEGAAGQASQ